MSTILTIAVSGATATIATIIYGWYRGRRPWMRLSRRRLYRAIDMAATLLLITMTAVVVLADKKPFQRGARAWAEAVEEE